tara:strand:- start:453 stop:1133 length:681 start_codon:yes stop_codon:yes gene_type:complete
MRIESKLCHLSENKAVVQVYGWINEKNVGSALAEGTTVELAEDKAILRLNKRINMKYDNEDDAELKISQDNSEKIKPKLKVELPIKDKPQIEDFNQEPNDWSNELIAIDSEIKRLNWSRDDEISFLQENIGYNNRNKITKYDELINYLNILKKVEIPNPSKSNSFDINRIIEESDNVLKDLSWDYKKGREYLQREFNVSTRKELNEKQLISFLSKLKAIRNDYLSK